MKELSLEKTLLLGFLFIVFVFILTLKIGGGSSLPELVEKDGYCKAAYGDNWDYHEQNEYCYATINRTRQEQTFTEQEFRDVCPKNSFLSTRFYSECFHKGDSRS